VADPGIGGPGGPPIDQNLGRVLTANQSVSDSGANFHLNPFNFGHFLYENGQKAFCLTPTAPGLHVLRAFAMANPGSTTVQSL